MREPDDYFYKTVILKEEFIEPYDLLSMAYSATEKRQRRSKIMNGLWEMILF